MTIKECIDLVDSLKPNQYTIKEKVMWLNFIEQVIINEVLKTHEGYDGRYDNFEGYSEDKMTMPMIVPSPYDRLYTQYLKMKIDEENGEVTRYNNSASLYNAYMSEYRRHYNKTHIPIDTSKRKPAKHPTTTSASVTDAQLEGIKNELAYILTNYFADSVSAEKIYNAVMNYMSNNAHLFKGENGKDGKDGEKGEPGYRPIKGIDYTDGKNGTNGRDGKDGEDGRTPIKGIDYFDGKDGKDGRDGEKGEDGYTPIKGIDYTDGKDGYTPVKGVDYFDGRDGEKGEDGYTPIKGIDYRDGIDGKNGNDGKDGKDGKTPVKGVDYMTDADKVELFKDMKDKGFFMEVENVSLLDATATGDWAEVAISEPIDIDNNEYVLYVNGAEQETVIHDHREAEDMIAFNDILQYYSASSLPLEITIMGSVASDTKIQLYRKGRNLIDEECIPGTIARKEDLNNLATPDLNQNDENAPDYIKNRTHYEGNVLTGEGTTTDDFPTIELSQPFDWNNAEIFVSGEKIEYEVFDDTEPGGDDFVEIYYNGQSLLQYYDASTKPLVITISRGLPLDTHIQIYQKFVKTLDEKYIPENIARVSDVEKVEVDVEEVKADVKKVETDVARLDRVVEQMSTSSGTGIVNTATGDAMKLTDSADGKAHILNVYGKTTQNGTPTPDAPLDLESVGESVEVSVYDGKNICDYTKCVGITNNDNNFVLEGDTFIFPAGNKYYGLNMTNALTLIKGQTYTFSFEAVTSYAYPACQIRYTDDTLTVITNGQTVTIENKDIRAITFYVGAGTLAETDFKISKFQVEIGKSVTEYEPFKALTTYTVNTPNGLKGIPVKSGGNYTDSNGQRWICDEIDYNRGVYIQRIGEYRNTGAPMACYTTVPNAEKDCIYWNDILRGIKLKQGFAISNCFTYGWGYATIPYIVGVANDGGANSYLYFSIKLSDTEYGTTYTNGKEAVNAWITKTFSADNPLIVYYVLETPIETPITEEMIEAYTHYPATTILSGKAGLRVDYVADTKNYIDNKFAQLETALLSIAD